jgi:subtilisin family serine protease
LLSRIGLPLVGEPASPSARALAWLGADAWHAAGHRGKGVTIAILDSGLKGYRQAEGKALPSGLLARSFRRDGRFDARDSQHGLLCADVAHQIAPEARLLLANWEPESPERFLEAVAWARKQGARVLSCSMIMPTWSDGEGGGQAHEKLRELLGPRGGKGDALLFASAGNTAQRHWGGRFTPGKDGWHQWAAGKADNTLRPLGEERVSAELVHPEGMAFQMVVTDATSGELVGKSRSSGHSAVVRFQPRPGSTYSVRVRQATPWAGPGPARFHLTILGGRLAHPRSGDSIPFPGDGAEVCAVAAVNSAMKRQSYSSCGPGGGKPDLCAVVPFPSKVRPDQPFSGTSAAAPQAAAAAALIWAREPDLTAAQVRARLLASARKAQPRHCPETGHGAVRLPPVR